jgi:hypothetical protein
MCGAATATDDRSAVTGVKRREGEKAMAPQDCLGGEKGITSSFVHAYFCTTHAHPNANEK